MSLNNIRAVGDDRRWKDEVERELAKLIDILKYGKISLRATAPAGGGGGGGSSSAGADAISATLPATYDAVTYVVGVDQDSFDRIGNLDYAQFDTATAATLAEAKMSWDATVGTMQLGLTGGNVHLHLGQAQYALVKNATGVAFTKGQVVYPSGSVGASGALEVNLARASSDATSAQTFGVVAEAIADEAFGYVQTYGVIEDVDTSALTAGQVVYLSPSFDGGFTSTKPLAPNHMVYVGFCLRSNASTGMIFIKPQNGYELYEIHDVKITDPVANNELLAYTSATDLWENKTAAEASLLTTSATLDSLADVVITTPSVDQVIKYDGTNFVNAASPGGGGGTVTSVTAGTGLSASPSSPITTSGTLNVTDVAINPVGSVTMFAGSGAPSGWLLCDGTAVSRTTYATLFAAIGTAYGAGNGSTTFNLPSMTARFPRGATTAGTGAGSDTHTHPLSNAGQAKIRRAVNRIVLEDTATAVFTANQEVSGTGGGSSTGGSVGAGLAGSTDSGNNVPLYTNFRFIIKT